MDSEKGRHLKRPVNTDLANSTADKPTVLVVISHYNAWASDQLITLLDQMHTVPAGYPFQTRIVVNRAEPHDLDLPPRHQSIEVVYRENTGYNIGAWEQGWREPPAFDAYLFLQEECLIVRSGWLRAFVEASNQTQVGLVGESLRGEFSWQYLEGKPQYAESYKIYREFFEEHRTPMGDDAAHLQSLVLFARHEILERIDGFPIGHEKIHAMAAEIAISKRVVARGYQIRQVGWRPFRYIVHPQWQEFRNESAAMRWHFANVVRTVLDPRLRVRLAQVARSLGFRQRG
jgi:hypothetical protein